MTVSNTTNELQGLTFKSVVKGYRLGDDSCLTCLY